MIALILIALAGLSGVAAGVARWRGRPAGAALAVAFALLTAALLAAAIDGGQRDLLAAGLGVWAAFGALLFVVRSLSSPTPWLLALPAAAVALLIALASLTPRSGGTETAPTMLIIIHAGFQMAHLAGVLVAVGAAATWLMADAGLRRAQPAALRLPSLPVLERIAFRFAIAACALLIGGVATGGLAMAGSTSITIAHPAIWCAVASLAMLSAALLGFQLHAVRRRSFHLLLIIAAAPSVAGALILVGGRHG